MDERRRCTTCRRGPARRRRARAGPDRRGGDHGRARGARRPPTWTRPCADADFVFSAIRVGGLAGPHARRAGRARPGPARAGDDRPGRSGVRAAHRAGRRRGGRAGQGRVAPARLGHQLHQPGRHDHRGDAAGAGRARRRHLRLADRAGPACRPRARARPGPHVAGLRGAQPPRLAARAVARRPGRAARPARRRHPALPASRRAASSAPTGSAAWGRCPTSTSTTTTSPATRWPRSAAARRPGGSSCSTSSAASTTRSPPTRRRPSGSGTGCAGSVTPAT